MLKSDINSPLRRESDPKYPTNSEAFNFLSQCAGAKFDWTSAEPPNPKKANIFPPQKILTLLQGGSFDFDSFTEVKGTSRGEEQTLQECVNFFQQKGINAYKENVSLNDNILSALEKTYEILKLSQERKIIVPTPTFGYYFKQFKDKNIGFETFATKAEDGFLPNLQDLEEAIIRSDAKALLLCYPNNPTGAVMTEKCAREIAEITARHNVFVISDEAFLNNSLSEKTHFPIAAIDGMINRSLTITSTAKSMFIGNKTGFCVGHPEIIVNFEKLGGYPNKHSQKILNTGLDIAKWMFEESSIATFPSECFLFDEKQMLVRIALKQPQQEIEVAFDNMALAAAKIENYSKSPSPKALEKLDGLTTKKAPSQANRT
jgi:aspartate/methionine/tyrosine aminotransferase